MTDSTTSDGSCLSYRSHLVVEAINYTLTDQGKNLKCTLRMILVKIKGVQSLESERNESNFVGVGVVGGG